MTLTRTLFCCILLLLLAQCATKFPVKKELLCLREISLNQLPGWKNDDLRPAFNAFKNSCAILRKQERGKKMGLSMSVGIWHDVCILAEKVPAEDAKKVRHFFEENFVPYRAFDQDNNEEGLYTGYYESALNGSLLKSEKYQYPLYKRPLDLVKEQNKYGRKEKQTLIPYYDRKSIDAGALNGKGLELLWVDCPVDAFFLHIQGSGRVRLEGGQYIGVGYDGANGHPYTAIGKILIERGEIRKEDMSMQAIRDWIKKHPQEGQQLMEENASYVFFRTLDNKGAVGAQGVPVSTGRTLAIDNRYIPYGIPVWLDVTHPQNKVNIQRLMIAQDTGGAIRGPLRGDVFWGFGGVATRVAGEMKSKGRSYLLLPKRVSFAGCYKG